jgi:hypothetical protein
MPQADPSPTTNPEIVDLAKLRNLALMCAEKAAVKRDPDRRRQLEQQAIRLWQQGRLAAR